MRIFRGGFWQKLNMLNKITFSRNGMWVLNDSLCVQINSFTFIYLRVKLLERFENRS